MYNLNLSLKEKIGQMIIFGINEENVTGRLIKMIKDYKVGGIILYKKNYKTAEELINLINKLKKANKDNKLPLFISIDQEGGRVNRMPNEFKNLKSSAELIKENGSIKVVKAANIISQMLNVFGINMVFAPVLDIQRFSDNHAIGDRCYGKTEEEVSKYAIGAMKKFKQNNIISVVKHFPGHGATSLDSHFFLPTIRKNIDELEKTDMKPFEKAIEEGVEAIMLGHLRVRGINNYLPVSLSKKFIIKYLRRKYRFRGLIITDDLKMKAIHLGANIAARKAFEAGNDLIMMGFKEKEVISSINNIKRMVDKKKIKEARINRSIKRIIKVKEKYNINNNEITQITKEDINDINNMILELNKNILTNN